MKVALAILMGVAVGVATNLRAQNARATNGGGNQGGQGLFGVTRRSSMLIPNVQAARFFQSAGVPVTDPQRLNQADSAAGTYAAASRTNVSVARPTLAARPALRPAPSARNLSATASSSRLGQPRILPRPASPISVN